ncbi:MAG TPA: hypothetical protein VGC37_08900 [Friedmanniella sp.]
MPEQPVPATYVGAILTAVRSYDQRRIRTTLDEAREALGTGLSLEEVVMVVLRITGLLQSRGTMDASHERLLSGAITRWLAGRTALAGDATREGTVLLAAGPEDLGTVTLDTITLDCFHLLLAEQGVEVYNLGAHIPVAAVVLVVGTVQPNAVVMVSNTPTAASHAARSVTTLVQTGYPVYVAGTAFDSQFDQEHNDGMLLEHTMDGSVARITERHTHLLVVGRPPSPAAGVAGQPVARR